MRLKLIIDGYYHEIDSTNPELLGKWVVEIFGRITHPNPATSYQMQAWPSFAPGPDGQMINDWIADTSIIGQTLTVKSARDLVTALSAQVDEWEARLNDSAT